MQKYKVPDIHCMSCVRGIENALKKLDPDVTVNAEVSKKEIEVESKLSPEETRKIIEEAGFEAQELGSR